jgi:hypothetical protein
LTNRAGGHVPPAHPGTLTMTASPHDPLAQRLPRTTAEALAEADNAGEMLLHAAIHDAEEHRYGKPLHRYTVLVCVWNRCSDHERERFVRALQENAATGEC